MVRPGGAIAAATAHVLGPQRLPASLPPSSLLSPSAAEDFQRWRGGFYAPAAMAAAAVGGSPTEATLVDFKLVLALLHEDKGLGHGGAPRRAPPSTSRYTYEKPVKIYG